MKRVVQAAAAIVSVLAIVYVATSLYGWAKVWEHVAGDPDMGPVAFEGLRKTPKPNQMLVCPEQLCHPESVDRTSPVYAMPVQDLRSRLVDILSRRRDLVRVDDDSDPLAARYVARSRWMRWPDTVRIRFIELPDNRSTIAIYSQAQIGSSDFGANKARIEDWLKALSEFEA